MEGAIAMSTKHAHESAHAQPRASGDRRLPLTAVGAVALAVAAVAVVLLKPLFAPSYWTTEDLGPVRTNAAPAPGPAPDGMVWIAGGTFL